MSLTIYAFLACCVVCSFTLRDLSTPQQAEEGSIDVTHDTMQEANQTGFIGTSSVLGEVPRRGMMCEPPKKILDCYTIKEFLNSGSFGSVSRATEKYPIPGGRKLVVKEMSSVKDFENVELDPPRLRLAFNSPDIVEAFYDPDLGKIYLVLEEMEELGSKLHRLYGPDFQKEKPNEVFEITCMLAWGVYNLHMAGIIHLDLKLENFMMHRVVKGLDYFKAVIIDYGLCRFGCGPDNPECGEGVAGSPQYMGRAQWFNVVAKFGRSAMREKAIKELKEAGKTKEEILAKLPQVSAEAAQLYPDTAYGPDCDWFAWAVMAHQLKTSPKSLPLKYDWEKIPDSKELIIHARRVLDGFEQQTSEKGGPANLAQSYGRGTLGFELLHDILTEEMGSHPDNVDKVIYYSRDPRDHPVLRHAFFYKHRTEAYLPIGWRQGRRYNGDLIYYLENKPKTNVLRWTRGQEVVESVDKYYVLYGSEPPPDKANTIIVRMTPNHPDLHPDLCKIIAGFYSRLQADANGNARYVKENHVSYFGDKQVFLYKASDLWVFYYVLEYPWSMEHIGRRDTFVFGYSLDGERQRFPPTTGWVFPLSPYEPKGFLSQSQLGLGAVIEFPTREFMMTQADKLEKLGCPGTVGITSQRPLKPFIAGVYHMDGFPFHDAPNYKSMEKIAIEEKGKPKYLRLYFMAAPYRGWYIGPDPGSMHALAFFPVESMDFPPLDQRRWKASGGYAHVEDLLRAPGMEVKIGLMGEDQRTGKKRMPYELSFEGVFWRRLCDDYHPLSKADEPAVECTRFQTASAVEEILSNPLCRTLYKERSSVQVEGYKGEGNGKVATVIKEIAALPEDFVYLDFGGGTPIKLQSKYLKTIS